MIGERGADRSPALDKAEALDASASVQRADLAGFGRLSQESLVSLDGFAFAADLVAVVLHGFADAMPQEPRGFHAAIKHPLNLTGADAFLAGAHQMDDLQPQMQRQVAGFKNSPHTHSEGFF